MSRFTANTTLQHDSPIRTGVLLCNLGTPDAPTPAAVRRYLGQFLWDPRVVELPRPLWWLLLHGIVLRFRPKKVAHAYASIWTDEGSPLLAISRRQRDGLAQQLGADIPVELGMCYGKPSIPAALEHLREQGVNRLLVLPLYPQYSGATGGPVFDIVSHTLQGWRRVPEVRFVMHYHDEPAYIEALAASIQAHWQAHGNPDRLLFSFHGMPKYTLQRGDPYHCECHKTARLVAERLGLEDEQWQLSFQSRFGKAEWLKPYTNQTLEALGKQGVGRVDVVCPGFSADCLETLEEIAVENRATFLESGGGQYHYIPALNDTAAHIDMLAGLAGRHLQGWEQVETDDELRERARRAQALGAEK
ncbi:MAG: ferrochelatase [Granulosicoccaceae bacterium]|jgi:ferrochelatase